MSRITIVYPRWPKIPEQTEFHLPPHGPVCLAAAVPDRYELRFIDEHVEGLEIKKDTDLVLL